MPRVAGQFFGSERRPYVRAEVVLPRFGVWVEVALLVDTGSDSTIIHWDDRQRLRTLDGHPLPTDAIFMDQAHSSGIAGQSVEYGRENAALFFTTDDGSRLMARMPIDISLAPGAGPVPSLLGRDVLEEARLDFNMPADELVLEWALA